MTFNFACRHCARTNEAELGWVNKSIDCSGCGRTILVPAPLESVGAQDDSAVTTQSLDRLKFRCQKCGRKYASRPELIGKKIRCGGCGAGVRVPDPGSVSSSWSPAVAQASPRESDSQATARALVKERSPRVPGDSRTVARKRVEPKPEPIPSPPNFLDDDEFPVKGAPSTHEVGKADLEDSSVVYRDPPDLPKPRSRGSRKEGGEIIDRVLPSRSEKMAEVELEMAAKEEAKVEKERKRKKKRSKSLANKHIGGGMIMQDVVNILGASVVGITVISLICWQFPGARFPIGGGLTVFGFIVYLLGTFGFSKVASEEGAHYSLMCRFVPLYKWYYLFTRWDEMKGHFVFFCVGLMFLWPGLFILKISPQGQKAEASEKAYNGRFEKEPPLAPSPVDFHEVDVE